MTDPANEFTTDELAQALVNLGDRVVRRALGEIRDGDADQFEGTRRLIEAGQRLQLVLLLEAEPGVPLPAVELQLRNDLDEATTVWRIRARG